MSTKDPRLSAFLSDSVDVFHSIEHRHEIWRPDPFDVETVHAQAREAFGRLLVKASTPPGLNSGRILLLLGDSGCGKTHLIRAFRAHVHRKQVGFVGYMQMTTATSNYGRYVLTNLIDSLDQPYDDPAQPASGLMKLSRALLARCGKVAALLAEPDTDAEEIPKLVEIAVDELLLQPRFADLDMDLMRALLFLQRGDPRIKSRVLRYLRCEDMAEGDRRVLGGLVPRIHDDQPQRTVEALGRIMWALEHVLVLCVDQLEDIFNLESADAPFRRAMQTLCDIADRVPSSVVVISCLADFWSSLRDKVTKPVRDRIELDPEPLALESGRTAEEARLMAARRLAQLYEVHDAPFDEATPTWPFPPEGFEALSGLRARDILVQCRQWRERAIREGKLPEGFPLTGNPPGSGTKIKESSPVIVLSDLEQVWNDYRTEHKAEPPEEDEVLAELLSWALRAATDEVDTGHRFDTRALTQAVHVDVAPEGRLHVALCNMDPRGGGLSQQLTRAAEAARKASRSLVIARTTSFPSSPRSQVAEQLGKLLAKGARRTVLEDSELRMALALRDFRREHEPRADFSNWLRSARPLTQLKSVRDILDLDRLRPVAKAEQAPEATKAPPAPKAPEPAKAERESEPDKQPEAERRPPVEVEEERPELLVGREEGLFPSPVWVAPQELTQHAAFLGGSGSGKTTLALSLVEQLLLRGVPAVLVDRKGDLAGYATDEFWSTPLGDARLEARRARLKERVEVALFTPGHPQGRPLAIPLVPENLALLPEFEREQATRHSAEALGGMMNLKQQGQDLQLRVMLAQALDQLVQLLPDGRVTMEQLVRFVGEQDPRLTAALGRLDTRLLKKLEQHLETLRLQSSALVGSAGEKLDMDLLLGRGAHSRPGRTRLTIISTRFLGDNARILFWVSQLLIEVRRWMTRHPSGALQAVLLFDEADMYLPAQRQPSTKEPMEDLLKRARSAGVGLMLATQSPGDLDYRCRDTIRSWFVGRVKEKTSLDKMRPMLSEARVDFTLRIPNQATGEFHVMRAGNVERVKAERSALSTRQLSDEEILQLAERGAPKASAA